MRTKWLTLPVVGTTWTVYIADSKNEPELWDSKELEGRCLYWENTILVNRRVPESRRADILVHELLHAVVFLSGARQTCGLGETEDEENLVITLAGPLTAALAGCGALKFPEPPPATKKARA